MAKAKDQGFNIRHRLVGAIVLLGLGVVFIPMILQGKGPGAGTNTDDLTEEVQEWIVGTEKTETFTTRVNPVSVDENNQPQLDEIVALDPNAEPELMAIDDEFAPTQSESVQQQTIQAVEPEPVAQPMQEKVEPQKKTPEPVQTASLKSENVSRGWMVQVGTFSKSENAQNLISKLNKVGFDSRYEVINTDSGQATRVWVGPYEKRVTAGRALEAVKEKTGVKGFIKSYP